MKLIIGAALAALLISGCAKDEVTAKRDFDSQQATTNLRTMEAAARVEEAKADAVLVSKLDAGGAAAVLLAKALKGLGIGQAAPVQVVQQPQSLLGLAWQSLLQVADIALRGYGIKANRDVSVIQSNNNRDVSLSTNATFGALGASIATAGTAGYPYIQAPGAVTNTTNTVSGSGVIGSGTNTMPTTTTTTTTTDSHDNPSPTVVTCVGTPPVCTR